MPSVLVLAAYRFVEIDDCAALRERLGCEAVAAALKGTILIAPQGRCVVFDERETLAPAGMEVSA